MLFACAVPAFAGQADRTSAPHAASIAMHADASGRQSLQDVRRDPFGTYRADAGDRGAMRFSDGALWLRFTLVPGRQSSLVFRSPVRGGTLYAVDGAHVRATPFGSGRDVALPLGDVPGTTYYLRLTAPLAQPPSFDIMSGAALAAEQRQTVMLVLLPAAIICGALLTVAIGSAILGLILGDKSYALFAFAMLAFCVGNSVDVVSGTPWLTASIAHDVFTFAARAAYGIALLLLCGTLQDGGLIPRDVYRLAIGAFGTQVVGGALYLLWPAVIVSSGLFTALDPALTATFLACAFASILMSRHGNAMVTSAEMLAFAGAFVGLTVGRGAATGLLPHVPLTVDAPALGMLWQILILFVTLAYRIQLAEGVASSLVSERDELEDAAFRDVLTGIPNRRAFEGRLSHEWRRAARLDTTLAMILIDIDFFKPYNDTFGHPGGDEALATVARVIAVGLRGKEDFVARYGGEEFVVILPDCEPADAARVAERVREEVRGLAVPHPGSPAGILTISAGAASIVPRRTRRSRLLVERADAALYVAKRSGRDRVSLSGNISVSVPDAITVSG
ncbi:MAG: hypothetical protein NVS3B7_02900 [Candidatus Elarobacter sp.]